MARLIATIGLHGSASTWAYNVVRELMMASLGEAQVRAVYADTLMQLSEDERALTSPCLIVKSHHANVEMDKWLADNNAYVIVSIRDPRDAAISMARRFRAPLQAATTWILNDCKRIVAVMDTASVVLRYEDRPFDSLSAVHLLADKLELSPSETTVYGIFERYRPEAVRSFADRLENLPEGRLGIVSAFKMDQVTQIFEVHIGDTQSGKWRDLPTADRVKLTRAFANYLGPFGYDQAEITEKNSASKLRGLQRLRASLRELKQNLSSHGGESV